MIVYDRFLSKLVDMADYDAVKNQQRMADALSEPMTHAQHPGAAARGPDRAPIA